MEKKSGNYSPIITTALKVYSVADNIISPLGFDTAQNYNALVHSKTGISKIPSDRFYPEGFYGAHIGDEKIAERFDFEGDNHFTQLEKMFILSIKDVLNKVPGIDKKKLLLIFSTTKGNIELMGSSSGNKIEKERVLLSCMARVVANYFKLPHEPLVISNACISGVSAILTGRKLIRMGLYDHVLVTGGDTLSEFTISGFQCLKAVSDEPCRPYDVERKGVTLGEACGSILLSKDPGLSNRDSAFSIIAGGGQANDANHISGPSRTGKGLKIAIEKALKSAKVEKSALGYINAHGTATLFNDEMEAIAFNDLGMEEIPLNSLKGYYGHTLGASGVIESILSIWQLNHNLVFKSGGYEHSGVSRNIRVLKENHTSAPICYALKTASGFGGCNAALIIEKDGSGYINI